MAGREQALFAVVAAPPDGTDGVDDESRPKLASSGCLRLAGCTTAQPAALLKDGGPTGTVDGAVDASTA
jgi:hypothetical protein